MGNQSRNSILSPAKSDIKRVAAGNLAGLDELLLLFIQQAYKAKEYPSRVSSGTSVSIGHLKDGSLSYYLYCRIECFQSQNQTSVYQTQLTTSLVNLDWQL
ncbi:718_t:CDS:2 [Entrophospora sp. SA101]|nr:12749_t:CDS:2 [Entrophospora sp. SA101]CAJ0755250.1 718_t:CDS:2 [Entrophospora sp. SA101]